MSCFLGNKERLFSLINSVYITLTREQAGSLLILLNPAIWLATETNGLFFFNLLSALD